MVPSFLTKSIGRRLGAIFLLMLVLVILAGVVGSMGVLSIQTTVQESLDSGFRVSRLVQQARMALGEVEWLENFYLANYERFGLDNARAAVQHAVLENITRFEAHLTEVETLLGTSGAAGGGWSAAGLIDQAEAYQAGILQLITAVELRGTFVTSSDVFDLEAQGYIGSLCAAATVLEEALTQPDGNPALLSPLLQLRLAESAYLMRGQVRERYHVLVALAELREGLALAADDPAEDGVAPLIDDYQVHFEAVSRQDQVIERAIQSDRGTVIAINLALGEIEDLAAQRVNQATDNIFTRVNQVLTSITVAIILAFLLGGGLAVVVARSIIRPLRRIKQIAQSISDGDLSQRVAIPNRDEIYDLAVSFNHMTTRLQETLAGLQVEIAERQRAETALRLTSFAVEHATDAVHWLDADARIVEVNQATCRTLGYTREELIGMSLREIDPVFDFDGWQERWEAVRAGPVPPLETTHKTRDGRLIPIEVVTNHIEFEGQELHCAFARDITHRKEAQAALYESEARYRALVESQIDLISRYRPDTTLTYVNDAYCKFYGKTREELIGQSYLNMVAPEFREMSRQEAQSMVQAPRMIVGEYLNYAADGKECWIQWVVQCVFDEQGQVVELQAVGRDITRLKQAEADLRASEERYRLLSELASDYAYMYSVDEHQNLRLEWITEEPFFRITGIRSSEIEELTSLYHPDDVPLMEQDNRELLAGRTTARDYRLVTALGELRWVQMASYPIWDQREGRVVRFYGVGKDITERRAREEEISVLNTELEQRVIERTAQLKASNQELEDFAYVVSHDLKAPLRGISQLVEWLGSDYAEAFNADGREMLSLLAKRTARMNDLIDGILQYSRVGRVMPQQDAVDLNEVVQDVVDALALSPHIQVTVVSALPRVTGDRTRFEQVLQNLIGNAVKFMGAAEGRVIVDCHDEGEQWRLSVADNGPGIDPKYHAKIFQIFQTLDSPDKHGGTGIGLALVKRIVERWGGTIWVESAVGQGSTFYFTMPKE
ncbi:MAG: PAS domain S-box protein [Anaerolineae bacterium]|nr:PAS domain S-box protein [Anaerolineae bacterium]